jgi:hypothetical protein
LAQALTAPFLVGALVLCTAGMAKLRSPVPAMRALAGAGLPDGAALVRAFAGLELALGIWAGLDPSPASAAAVAGTFMILAGVAALLVRRASSCGCFGDHEAPASQLQPLLSAGLATIAGAAAVWPPHGLVWVLGRPPATAAALVLGVAGAAYATVLAYTELPTAWGAWSPQ